ncbi:dTDP-4-dehydrorhamnose reductase [Pseudomonadota bacterium]
MKTVVLGKDGQLGQELGRSNSFGDVVMLGRKELDLTDLGAIERTLGSQQADLIINAAAYTAVDQAETDESSADIVNHQAPRVLAECAASIGAWLIHYSTDYVFAGDANEPYPEDAETVPKSVYGASKLAGEQAVREVGGQFLIFRTSWVYAKHGRNFLNTVYRLAEERGALRIVNDQFGSPTTTKAITDATVKVVEQLFLNGDGGGSKANLAGIYHMTCGGETNWYEFAQAILAESNLKNIPVEPIPTSAYPTPAPRPFYSVLDNRKLADRFAVRLPHWKRALADCLQQ